jgi:Sulfotransferase family
MAEVTVTPATVGNNHCDVAATRPVFVVGCARSGTTLVQQLLNRHPAVAIGPETHFVRRFLLRRAQYGDLTVPASFDRLLDDVTASPEFADFGIDAADFRAGCLGGVRTVGHVFHRLLAEFASLHNVSVVGEKTPNHCLYMRQLESVFPAARFIAIVRDPRAVVASLREVEWSTGTLVGDARVWRRCAAAIEHDRPRRAPLRVISYEHLLRAPDEVMESVFAELGVAASTSAPSANWEVVGFDLDREPWKVRATGAVDPSRAEAWRSKLSVDEVRAIEAVTWHWMRRYGYRPATPIPDLARPLVVETVGEWWRRAAKAFHAVRRRGRSFARRRQRADR